MGALAPDTTPKDFSYPSAISLSSFWNKTPCQGRQAQIEISLLLFKFWGSLNLNLGSWLQSAPTAIISLLSVAHET